MASDLQAAATSHSFESLMHRAAEGSEEAVWELLERYSKNILRVVRRYLPAEIRSKVDSTDIVQSVWKSLLRKGAKLEPNGTPQQLIAYLAGMARLKVYETHRHYTTMKAFDLGRERSLHQASGPDDTLEERNSGRELQDMRSQEPGAIASSRENWHRAMELSGERGRKIVELRLRGLTLTEVAEEMQISVSTVRRVLESLFQSLTT
jgi:RNA polymerase sigma factor (sigma-70 family)